MTDAQKIELIVTTISAHYDLNRWQVMFTPRVPRYARMRANLYRLILEYISVRYAAELMMVSPNDFRKALTAHPENKDYRVLHFQVKYHLEHFTLKQAS